MKKSERIPTWEEMLEIEDKHPFSAGSLPNLRPRVQGEAALLRYDERREAARKKKNRSTKLSARAGKKNGSLTRTTNRRGRTSEWQKIGPAFDDAGRFR
jgi:hypothetical protein